MNNLVINFNVETGIVRDVVCSVRITAGGKESVSMTGPIRDGELVVDEMTTHVIANNVVSVYDDATAAQSWMEADVSKDLDILVRVDMERALNFAMKKEGTLVELLAQAVKDYHALTEDYTKLDVTITTQGEEYAVVDITTTLKNTTGDETAMKHELPVGSSNVLPVPDFSFNGNQDYAADQD